MNFTLKLRKLHLLVLPLVFFSFHCAFAQPNAGLKFIENKNQWPSQVFYSSAINGGRVYLLKDRFRFNFLEPHTYGYGKHSHEDNNFENGSIDHSSSRRGHTFDVTFLNSNSNAILQGEKMLKTHYNFLLGNDPSKWGRKAKSFSQISYNNVYEGIDLLVYSDHDRMKYEWIVSPETDPSIINLQFNGADRLSIENGNLRIHTSINEIIEYEPYAYQLQNEKKIPVPCLYVISNNIVSYYFPEGFDECLELTIDPILIFSAYSGSTSDNWGNTATYDQHGNTYSGGIVESPLDGNKFPTTVGAFQTTFGGGDWDVGILKYDSSGSTVLYTTYLGGNGVETPQSLVVNSKDELLILGATSSTNFPVTNSSAFKGGDTVDPIGGVLYVDGTDIFVAKLSADGETLLSGTYLGGSNNDGVNFISGEIDKIKVESPLARNYGDQLRGDIIVDENDTVYVASNTMSNDFDGTFNSYGNGPHDAVVIKLLPDLSSIKWARYLGGSKSDAAYSIKLKSNLIYLAGGTNSTNFPGVNGIKTSLQGDIDGWLASLSQVSGKLINATYIGTDKYDQTYFIDLNEAGEVYTYGQTKGQYPVTENVLSNSNEFGGQFIHKLSSDLKATIFSTTIGSTGTVNSINPNISPTAFLVNDCNTLFISGWGGGVNRPSEVIQGKTVNYNYVGGNTKNMPISDNAYQKATQGSDFYLAVLSADSTKFLYGTYLGGSKSKTHVDGGTSRFDKKGIVYHAVCAGCGGVSDFPAINAPIGHSANRSSNCNNAVFKFDLSILKARLQTNSTDLDMPGLNRICIPDGIIFQNKSIGGETFQWNIFDTADKNLLDTVITKTDTTAILYKFKKPGKYKAVLTAIDPKTCAGKDSISTIVYVFKRKTKIQDNDDECFGVPYDIKAFGYAFFDWTTKDNSFEAHDRDTIHTVTPPDTTMYYVTITEDGGCIRKDSVRINIIPSVDIQVKLEKINDCFSRPKLKITDISKLESSDYAIFDFGDGQTSDADHAVHYYENDDTYHIKLTVVREFCTFEKSFNFNAYVIKSPNVITPGTKDDHNDFFTIQYGSAEGKTPKDFGLKVSILIYNRWGKLVYQSDDYNNDWNGEGLASGVYFYEVKIGDEAFCKDWIHLVK
jgi:gliding motility-associated-like protein